MTTTIALLATLVAIWFLTSVALFVHANTQDKLHASESAHTVRQAQALASSTIELLDAFYTVQAERDLYKKAFENLHEEHEDILDQHFTLTAEDFAQ